MLDTETLALLGALSTLDAEERSRIIQAVKAALAAEGIEREEVKEDE